MRLLGWSRLPGISLTVNPRFTDDRRVVRKVEFGQFSGDSWIAEHYFFDPFNLFIIPRTMEQTILSIIVHQGVGGEIHDRFVENILPQC